MCEDNFMLQLNVLHFETICLQGQLAAAKLRLLWWWSVHIKLAYYKVSQLPVDILTPPPHRWTAAVFTCCWIATLPLTSQPWRPRNHPICTQAITIHTLWDSKYQYTWSNGLSYFSWSLRGMMILQDWSTSSQWGIPWSRALIMG